jgi:hypothetical protein
MDVHLGVEGSNSNGNAEEIDKEVNMMKIIERLQKDVQTHRADKKKLMKFDAELGSTGRIQPKFDAELGKDSKEIG